MMQGNTLITTSSIVLRLEHGKKTEETSSECASSDVLGIGGTSVLLWGTGCSTDASTVAGGDLGLTVADLGDDWANRSRCLRLAIRDLGDNGSCGRLGCTSLRLAIRDLRDNWSCRGLGCTGLRLAIRDLRDDAGSGSTSLRLTVGDLGDAGWCGDLGLTVTDLGGTGTASLHSSDVDRNALCTGALAVQVVEVTREALVKDSWCRTAIGRESEGVVATEREPAGFLSTGLNRSVELELIVGGNVSLAASLVLQNTVVEGEGQGTGKLARLEITLSLGSSDIDGLDIEGSRSGSLATRWGALSQRRRSGESEDSEGLHFQKIDRTDYWITDIGLLSSEGG